VTANIVLCDNYATCASRLDDKTYVQARVKGWHIYEGTTPRGIEVVWILCPACVGKRGHGPRPPQVLNGQEELF